MGALPKLDWMSQEFCDLVFAIIMSISFALRVFLLAVPERGLIFDEYYYVNSARVILGLPQSTGEGGSVPYPTAPRGIDPNLEHPPLAKLLMALSIQFLGDNAYSWRMPGILLGILSTIALYELMRVGTGSASEALFGSFLYAFDTLVFVHSRIATLDIYSLAFLVLGMYLYFSDQPILSGVSLGLSALCKETGVFGALALVVHALVCSRYGGKETKNLPRRKLLTLVLFVVAYAASFLGFLYVLDSLWGGFGNPIDHILYIYTYASGLVSPGGPSGVQSYPWQWLLNEVQIPYLRVSVAVSENGRETGSYTTIHFAGALNPFILLLTVPAMVYQGYLWRHDHKTFPLLLLCWFALTYLPYYPMALIGHRTMYLFYFLHSVPAVCAAVASMLKDSRLPRAVVLAYCISVTAGFAAYFPFKRLV